MFPYALECLKGERPLARQPYFISEFGTGRYGIPCPFRFSAEFELTAGVMLVDHAPAEGGSWRCNHNSRLVHLRWPYSYSGGYNQLQQRV